MTGIFVTSLQGQEESFARWEKAISKFEAADKERLPAPGGVLFIGSSSMRRWDLEKYFPDHDYVNRGFGGSQVADSIHFADRIILPYRPKTILLYAGDNDIAAGKSAARVAEDFQLFVKKVHAHLPKARIGFVAIKPSIKRWELVSKMRNANQLIEKQTKTNPLLGYIDIDAPMIGTDGKPRKDLFAEDGLHLNHKGYLLWSSIVKPFIEMK